MRYREVNPKFADAVCEEAHGPDPVVLVQDYHFALLPRMIRERLPRATVITFWHIPWPNVEPFGISPTAPELLQGLLGSSILGFHTQAALQQLPRVGRPSPRGARRPRAPERGAGRAGDAGPRLPHLHRLADALGRRGAAGARLPRAGPRRSRARAGPLLGVGIDRLDYTKGIEERLLAVERLLERFPQFRGRFTFVQLAAPSRTRIPRYQELTRHVEEVAARVNARFGDGRYRPIVLLREHHEPPTVFRYYRAADLCYVSSCTTA